MRYRETITVKTVTLYKKLHFFIKSLKSKKKKLALTSSYYVSREIWLGNSKNLICIDQSRFYIFLHSRDFKNIVSNFFSFFNNKPPVIWIAHVTRDFLTYYSCLHYSSMPKRIFYQQFSCKLWSTVEGDILRPISITAFYFAFSKQRSPRAS